MSKKNLALRYLPLIISILLALGFLNVAWATPPEIYSITPDIGSSNVATEVTISGASFQETPNVALYGKSTSIGASDTIPCFFPNITRVQVEGSYAYAGWFCGFFYPSIISSGFEVIDISNPANRRVVGKCDTQGTVEDIHVAGSYAYVIVDYFMFDDSSLLVIDISNPANPLIVGECDTPDHANAVYVAGSYAYVVDSDFVLSYSRLLVIDISNPAYPSFVCECDTSGWAYGVYIADSYAYVADRLLGLQVIDIRNPATPSIVGVCDTPDEAWGVYVVGNYAYVADGDSGLQVIDISNPVTMSIVGACDTLDGARVVHVAGSYAYVAVGYSGLQVIDISNPANPLIVGTCDTPGFSHDIHVAGSYAYVADAESGLQLIDISDPTNPKIVEDLIWDMAYKTMLEDSSDLGLLRQYRDQFLARSTKGKLYTRLLYRSSEEALKVLLDNPALMRQASNLIRANKGAVQDVLNGSKGVIRIADAVISFLKAYGKKSPPALRFLTNEVMKEMRKKQRQGRPFLGFMLE